ncbi:hypothetical protein C6A77_06995 [Pseudomonas sp. AFG_SD02_1510_Pfu_092]|nr:hypothetical protein C6A77_06995 [Pseudomonas sp. AFG_SD02_1510_Pfu_092]
MRNYLFVFVESRWSRLCRFPCWTQNPVGAGLPAKAAVKPTSHSRVNPLPQCLVSPGGLCSAVQIALWVFSQPRPASVVVSGLYSAPTQPW